MNPQLLALAEALDADGNPVIPGLRRVCTPRRHGTVTIAGQKYLATCENMGCPGWTVVSDDVADGVILEALYAKGYSIYFYQGFEQKAGLVCCEIERDINSPDGHKFHQGFGSRCSQALIAATLAAVAKEA
jgi:hypothetical protein